MPADDFSAAGDIVVVSATDDGYAMPLAVTIRSALEHLAPSRRMQLYVLDGGLHEQVKERLRNSWLDPRLSVEWIRPDMEQFSDLPISEHISPAAYLRLLMPTLLPADVTRVIYLDADLLVQRDLGELWDEAQGDHAVLAVQDYAAPCFDATVALPTYDRCRPHLAASLPIANYRELGLPADGKYFNSGVLVVDLCQWRAKDYATQVVNCLREHRQHVLWWDQYALNVVLAGKWRALDQRWNQGAHIHAYPHWRDSPFDREMFATLRNAPWIVHFCSAEKPWNYFCRHPYTLEFYRCLDQTQWQGWQPAWPQNFLRQWWRHHSRPVRQRWKSRARAVKRLISPLERAA